VLGVNFDACNVFRASYVESGNGQSGWSCAEGKEDELTALRGVSDRVIHCHAKDINNAGKCVAVGDGIVNVKGCMEHLKSVGYSGVVSVETEGGDDFDEVVALAKKSYVYLNSIIRGE
jgi:sugar phosphate isomerase/epimerase